jgi:hypothetical protein
MVRVLPHLKIEPKTLAIPKRVRNADLRKVSCRFGAPGRLAIRRRQSADDRNRIGEIGRQQDNEPNCLMLRNEASGSALARLRVIASTLLKSTMEVDHVNGPDARKIS